MKRNRQSDQKKQEAKDVKRVEKNALESSRGHRNRQNTARGTRRRTRKDISKKGEYLARSNARRKYKDAPENRLRRGHQQREANFIGSEKEEGTGKLCLIWVFSNAKAQKNSNVFYQSSFDTSFSL